MIADVVLIAVFIVSLWIGWSIRIYINWLRFVWLIVFTVLISIALPHFITFVDHSSANFTTLSYYIFGLIIVVIIFLSIYLLFRGNKSSSSARRFAGSLALSLISFYSMAIVLVSMADYGWVNLSSSVILSGLPEWVMNPFR